MEAVRLSHLFETGPGFKYIGEGLDKGVCGMTIESVKANMNGQVECTLGTERDEYVGHIDLVVAREYLLPLLLLLHFLSCYNFP